MSFYENNIAYESLSMLKNDNSHVEQIRLIFEKNIHILDANVFEYLSPDIIDVNIVKLYYDIRKQEENDAIKLIEIISNKLKNIEYTIKLMMIYNHIDSIFHTETVSEEINLLWQKTLCEYDMTSENLKFLSNEIITSFVDII